MPRVRKTHCWEVKNCGRERGGSRESELGVCPASTCKECDKINGGKMGGRLCWALAGTLCGNRVAGTFAQKKASCTSCEFFKLVKEEERERFLLLQPGQPYKPRE